MRVEFDMDDLYWSWLVNEWRARRGGYRPGWSVNDFAREIMEGHAKHTIGNLNSAKQSITIPQARQWGRRTRKSRG